MQKKSKTLSTFNAFIHCGNLRSAKSSPRSRANRIDSRCHVVAAEYAFDFDFGSPSLGRCFEVFLYAARSLSTYHTFTGHRHASN
jgi:hypothetical protein